MENRRGSWSFYGGYVLVTILRGRIGEVVVFSMGELVTILRASFIYLLKSI